MTRRRGVRVRVARCGGAMRLSAGVGLLATIVLSAVGCSAPGGGPRVSSVANPPPDRKLRLSEAVVRDKIRGAWLGQMIGVTWGFPTEFYARYIWQLFPDTHQRGGAPTNIYAAYEGRPIPLDKLPAWKPELINGAYTQDDLYVEVPFIEAFRRHGVNAGWGPLGDAFAATQFPLYHANLAGRDNLRAGIRPPWSGHYSKNGHSDDIDWQIESDFVGLMTPGQPVTAADIAFRAGHIVNHGDGVYGGVFVATMISAAFTADSVRAIADAGRTAVPRGSLYRTVLDEVDASWTRGESYDANLAALYAKWGAADRCVDWAGTKDALNIDAKLNGAFILLGLLYGNGDLAASLRYAMAAGQDSDCNPSNVGSILGAFYGAQALAKADVDWLSKLDASRTFETTPFTLDQLVEMNVELARAVVEFRDGAAPRGGMWQIPVSRNAVPLILEQWPQTPGAPPTLTASVSVEQGRTARVRAAATAADGPIEYQWFFGDLTSARGPAHTHAYRRAGTYELVVFVADRSGNVSWETAQVVVP